MRNVYLSFLGLGKKQLGGSYAYDPTVYELNGRMSKTTAFVQAAEYEILGADRFDTAIIVDTEKSHEANYAALVKELESLGASNIYAVTIDEEMTAQGQWRWFESILNCIEPGDILTVDLTHGYRAAPIIFSAALNFLQKSRNVHLAAVYYGVFEKAATLGYAPVVDMKAFYAINEWAEAIGRLVEDADAKKLAHVAENTPDFQFGELNDEKLIDAFHRLTDTIKNVDVNKVAPTTKTAIDLIRQKEKSASQPVRLLLGLVTDKYISLTTESSPTGKFDNPYFQIQLSLIGLLLEHRLFMQAYTVMRECIASLGMVGFEKEGMNNKKRKKRRKTHAEIFIKMFQIAEQEWKFPEAQQPIVKRLIPFYNRLKKNGIEGQIRSIASDLADYRNGFDHAWTCKSKAYDNIEEKGHHFLQKLEKIVVSFDKEDLMP